MRYRKSAVAIAVLLSSIALGQERPRGVSLIELISTPEKFDKKVVDVTGYLMIEHQPKHPVLVQLVLHQEDAKNLLPNGILVVPSAQMLRDEEKINHMYVILRGTVRTTPTDGGGLLLEIKDVQNCVVWSNPDRPIGGGQAK